MWQLNVNSVTNWDATLKELIAAKNIVLSYDSKDLTTVSNFI